MHIEVVRAAPEQAPILANLLELYIHEFSEINDVRIGPDGRFGYKHLPLYWKEAGRFPYLFMVDEKLAGFALVKRGSEVSGDRDVWDLAEFFVLRWCRRRGVGRSSAHRLWRAHTGRWEVRVMELNSAAQQFWERAGRAFAGEGLQSHRIEKDGKRWTVFTFDSKEA